MAKKKTTAGESDVESNQAGDETAVNHLDRIPKQVIDHYWNEIQPYFLKWQSTSTFPHGLIFIIPTKNTRESTVVQAIIRHMKTWLDCDQNRNVESSKESEPCYQCPKCSRNQSMRYVDIIELAPDEDSKVIKVEQIRGLWNQVSFSPIDSPNRLVIVRRARELTEQSSNAMLKLLEEPPARNIFLFIDSSDRVVLPTILSRVQRIRLKPLPDAILKACVEKMMLDKSTIDVGPAGDFSDAELDSLVSRSLGQYEELQNLIYSTLQDSESVENDLINLCSDPRKTFTSFIDKYGAATLSSTSTSAKATTSKDANKEGTESQTLDALITVLEDWTKGGLLQLSRSNPSGPRSFINRAIEAKSSTSIGNKAARRFFDEQTETLARARHLERVSLNKKLFVQELVSPWVTYLSNL